MGFFLVHLMLIIVFPIVWHVAWPWTVLLSEERVEMKQDRPHSLPTRLTPWSPGVLRGDTEQVRWRSRHAGSVPRRVAILRPRGVCRRTPALSSVGRFLKTFLSTVTTLQLAWDLPALSTGRPAPQEPSELPWSWADQDDWSPVCGFLKVCMSCCDSCRSCEGGVAGAAVPGLQVDSGGWDFRITRQGSRWEGILGMKQSTCGQSSLQVTGPVSGLSGVS